MDSLNNVLLVDDDPVVNFISKLLLQRHKITQNVLIAENGEKGLSIIESFHKIGKCPELILLDINMPVMNGFEFLQGLKEQYYGIFNSTRICILTNSNDEEELEKMLSLGAHFWISKPLTKESLKRLISKEAVKCLI